MSDFRFKLKKPGMIQNFDDSDLSDCLSSTESSSPVSVPPAVKSQAVLPKSVPNHLLLVSILEQLCHMYTKDSKQAQDIFYSICNQLSNANVVSPLLILDEMSSLRTQYRLSVHKMLMAAIHKSNKGLTIGFPGSKSYALPAIAYSLPSEPSSRPEDMVNQTSRYKSEFVEMKTIGKGGFGSVFQSRNKLDGNLYAVKKVKFKHSKPEVWYKVLREVKALACLQHYNVVGYNAAWLEYEPIDLVKADVTIEATIGETNGSQSLDSIIFQDSQNGFFDYKSALTSLAGPKIKEITSDISETDSEIPSFTNDFSVSSQSHRTTDIVKFSTKKSVFETKFQTDLTSSRYIESQSTFSSVINNGLRKNGLENKTGRRVEFSLSTEFSDMNIERPPRYGRSISCDPHATGESPVTLPADRQAFVESAFSLKQSVTLYIQMELCDISLKEWLQKRNYACANEEEFIGYQAKNMIIFRQMLKGVDFIHSQGIIHRDLKPRNIFLIESSQRIHVKIGDFGLATDEMTSQSSDLQEPNLPRVSSSGKLTRSESNVSDHTSGVGTSTYAAPEQLRGSLYNTKSDIYSLGVVLYELFMQFKTESERIRSLDDLRKGIIYEKIFKYWPAQAHCIQQMTMHNPDKRPSISDLLHGELFLSKDQIIGDLKATNNLQQKEIERLNKLLAESYKTIDQLTSSVNPFMGTS